MPRHYRPRRHLRLARGRVACDTWTGDGHYSWMGRRTRGRSRAPLRTTADRAKVTCLRCIHALDATREDKRPDVGAVVLPAEWRARALQCAVSAFQRRLLDGREYLHARDRYWKVVPQRQLVTMLERFTRNGVPWRIDVRGKEHKHVLVIGGTDVD